MPLITSDLLPPTYRKAECRLCHRCIPKADPPHSAGAPATGRLSTRGGAASASRPPTSSPTSPPPSSRLSSDASSAALAGADEAVSPTTVIAASGDRYKATFDSVYHVQRTCSTRRKLRSQWLHRQCVRWAAPAGAPLSCDDREARGTSLWNLQAALDKKRCAQCNKGGASLCCSASDHGAAGGACHVRYHLPCLLDLWCGRDAAPSAKAPPHARVVIESVRNGTLRFRCAHPAASSLPPSPLSPVARDWRSALDGVTGPTTAACSLLVPASPFTPAPTSTRSALAALAADRASDEKSEATDGVSAAAGEEEKEEEEEEEEDGGESALAPSPDGSGSRLRLSQYVQAAQSLLASLHTAVSRHQVGHFDAEPYLRELSAAQEQFRERLRCIKVALFGRTGVGKSFLLNILCFLTCESPEAYRQRWRDAELRTSALEAYWDEEADTVCADLLGVIQVTTSGSPPVPVSGVAAHRLPRLSLDAAQAAAGQVASPSATALAAHSSSAAAASLPSAAVSSSSAPAGRGPRPRDGAALPLANPWEKDEKLSSWSQASWLPADPAAAVAPAAQDGEDEAAGQRPAQLVGSGSCVVVELSAAGSRELHQGKAADQNCWEKLLGERVVAVVLHQGAGAVAAAERHRRPRHHVASVPPALRPRVARLCALRRPRRGAAAGLPLRAAHAGPPRARLHHRERRRAEERARPLRRLMGSAADRLRLERARRPQLEEDPRDATGGRGGQRGICGRGLCRPCAKRCQRHAAAAGHPAVAEPPCADPRRRQRLAGGPHVRARAAALLLLPPPGPLRHPAVLRVRPVQRAG